jgi:NADH-quinone oxidoreductase subunit J
MALIAVLAGPGWNGSPTGQESVTGVLDQTKDLNNIGEALFTKYVFAFEITSLLLTIAVVGAVILSRKPKGDPIDLDEFPPIESEGDGSEPELEEVES